MLEYREKLNKEKKIRLKRVGDWFANTLAPSLENNGNTSFNFEIGCGHGHWLTSYAKKKPSHNFVGIDLISKRIEKANAKVEKEIFTMSASAKRKQTSFSSFVIMNYQILSSCTQIHGPKRDILREDLSNCLS